MPKPLLTGAVLALFAATPALACDPVASANVKMSACIEAADWVVQTPQGAQEFLYFSGDETIGFTIITEKETVAVSEYRTAILNNAAAGSNSTIDAVAVLAERIENIGGKPWNVIEYQIGEPGQELRFQNFYYVQPGFGSTQFVYWSIPGDATAAAYRAGQVLSTVEFTN